MVTAASKGKDNAAQPKKISWSEFEKRYLTREDKYKYEWLNGIVEKTESGMNQYQLFIAENLILFFEKLRTAGKVSGLLISEVDTFFLENHRKPDFAYFTSEQISHAAEGENQVPLFVIEVISTHDKTQKTQRKIEDYQAAGVQVIWEIMPALQRVNVYQGEDMSMKMRKGEDLCSATPVLPDFALTANAIFQKSVIS